MALKGIFLEYYTTCIENIISELTVKREVFFSYGMDIG